MVHGFKIFLKNKKIKEGIICIKKEFRYNKSNGKVHRKKGHTKGKGASV